MAEGAQVQEEAEPVREPGLSRRDSATPSPVNRSLNPQSCGQGPTAASLLPGPFWGAQSGVQHPHLLQPGRKSLPWRGHRHCCSPGNMEGLSLLPDSESPCIMSGPGPAPRAAQATDLLFLGSQLGGEGPSLGFFGVCVGSGAFLLPLEVLAAPCEKSRACPLPPLPAFCLGGGCLHPHSPPASCFSV